MRVAGLFDGVVIEAGYFLDAHAGRREPLRNVGVAKSLDVGEYLAGAGAGGGTRGGEGITDQHNAGAQIMPRDIEDGGTDLHKIRDIEVAEHTTQARKAVKQNLLRSVTEGAQPWILHVAIDAEIRPHRRADREHRNIGGAIGRTLGIIGHRREIELRPPTRHQIESQHDGMTWAQDLLRHVELVAQAAVQSIRQYHEARANRLAVGQRDGLLLRTERYFRNFAVKLRDFGRYLTAHRVDQNVIHDAVLVAGAAVEHAAVTRDPRGFIKGAGFQDRIGEPGLA